MEVFNVHRSNFGNDFIFLLDFPRIVTYLNRLKLYDISIKKKKKIQIGEFVVSLSKSKIPSKLIRIGHCVNQSNLLRRPMDIDVEFQ